MPFIRPLWSGDGELVITAPTEIPDLVLWLDGSDATSMKATAGSQPWGVGSGAQPVVTNDVVGYWADKSGQGNHVNQSNTSATPVYAAPADGINGKSTVTFSISGVDDFMYSTASLLTDPKECTVVYVAQLFADETIGTIFSNSNASTERLEVMMDNRAAWRWHAWMRDTSGASTITTTDYGAAEPQIFAAWTDGANISGRLNGVLQGLSPRLFAGDGVTTNDYTRIGAGYHNGTQETTPLDGEIGTVLVYDRTLTLKEIQALEVYLQDFWATPALP